MNWRSKCTHLPAVPRWYKASRGERPPKSHQNKKKAKQPSRTLFVWAKTLRRKRDLLDCFFFAETEAMLSRNWLENFRTRFGRFGFANYQVLPYSTCPNRFNSRFTKCHSAIVPCESFHLYATLRTRRSNGESRGVWSGLAMPWLHKHLKNISPRPWACLVWRWKSDELVVPQKTCPTKNDII